MKSSVIRAVAAISIFLLTPLVFILGQSSFTNVWHVFTSYPYWLFSVFFIAVFFLLDKIIVPQFYLGKKWILFYVSAALLVLTTVLAKPFDHLISFNRPPGQPMEKFEPGNMDHHQAPPSLPRANHGPGRPIFDIVSVFILLLIFLLVITDQAVRKARYTEQRATQAEADRANAELSFLKAQINPHFLFNTLNNIYSLAIMQSDKTAGAVMKLSNIMRYVTDGADDKMVPLEEEVSCIEDYIELQKLRLGEDFPVVFSVTGNMQGKMIPPLSLMTFVENAFKHGISNHEENDIVFKLQVQEKYIHFFARNKLFSTPRNTERTGIGIDNTRKRLNVLYPQKYLLDIEAANGYYTADIVLQN